MYLITLLLNMIWIWPVFGILWLLGVFVGIPITFIACISRAFEWVPNAGDRNEGYWRYTWPFMKLWSTYDNGACAYWYHHTYQRPLWLNCWIYSGFRNAFGGNPFNAKNVNPADVQFKSSSGSGTRLTTLLLHDIAKNNVQKRYWNITWYRWRAGIWLIFPFTEKARKRIEDFLYTFDRFVYTLGHRVLRQEMDKPTRKVLGPSSHFEIRHGWKLYPDAPETGTMVFSLWDTGPRLR